MDDMDTKHEHGHNPEENPAVSYERSDLDIFAVTRFGIGLAIGTLLAVFLMWGLFHFFNVRRDETMETIPQSMLAARKGMVPPEPRLQSLGNPVAPVTHNGDLRPPSVELAKLKEDELKQSQTYAWIDPAHGTVRIPIELAKDLLLKKGLPTKVTAEGQVRKVTPNPGEGVGTAAAAQPQRVYDTGAAAYRSTPVTELPKEETTEHEGARSEAKEKK
jgi:hypothetical protein